LHLTYTDFVRPVLLYSDLATGGENECCECRNGDGEKSLMMPAAYLIKYVGERSIIVGRYRDELVSHYRDELVSQ